MFIKASWVQIFEIMLNCFVVTFTDRMVYSGIQIELLQCLWLRRKSIKHRWPVSTFD